ncbi:MAG: hypothetical protein V2A58_00185 [Planctomycetota bacterium]
MFVRARWLWACLGVLAGLVCAFAALAQESGKEEGTLLREATRLIGRRGRLVSYQLDVLREPTASGSDRNAFVSVDEARTFVLLENEKLEELEGITRRGETVVKVWGTVYTYRGKNYLMLTRFRIPDTTEREENW